MVSDLKAGIVPVRYNDEEEPTPRAREIYTVINSLLHLYIGNDEEDEANGITAAEHKRRHFVFYCGFVAGLEYMGEYPRQAVRLLGEYRRHLAAGRSQTATDATMSRINEELFPFTPPASVANNLIDMAREYRANPPARTVENIRPTIVSGGLVWENVEEGKWPMPSWEEEFQEWM